MVRGGLRVLRHLVKGRDGGAAGDNVLASMMTIGRAQRSPAFPDRRVLVVAVLFLMTAAILIVGGDEWISHATLVWRPPGALLMWEVVGWPGDWIVQASILGMAAGVAWLARDLRLRAAGLFWLFALAFGGLVTTLLKHVTCRARPFLPEAGAFHPPFCLQSGMDSFPSGHSALAFAIAAILAGSYPRLSPLCYLAATMVGMSRVVVGVHYPSDVLAGAAIGLLSGDLCRYQLRRLAAAWQAQPEASQ